jgi:hypothetical protein
LPKLKHRLKLRFAVIAALALVFAQLGAMAHAYTHVPQTRAASAQPQQTSPSVHDFCSDCLNFAPLLAAAGAPAALPFALPQGCCVAPQAQLDSPLDLKLLLAFRSRAPPATRF